MFPAASSTSSFAERYRLRAAVALAAAALTFTVACGGDDKPSGDVVVGTAASPTAASQSSAADKPPATAPTTAPGSATASNEPLAFTASDGVTIKGHFYSAPGPKRRVLIVASSADQKTIAPYAAQIVGQGIALYTFDPRGVGETGGTKNDAVLERDLGIAVGLVQSRDYPLVYVFGVGNEAGGAAVNVASREKLAGVATYGAPSPRRITASVASQPADPFSAADVRQAIIDFALGK